MPQIFQIEEKREYLESYIETYLKEEILAEQVARNLSHFSRFLKTAALCSGELINFQKFANDAQLPPSTAKNYFEALQDTLIGSLVEPWVESKKRKAIQTAKFYLFDLGVRNRLLDINEIPDRSESFGKAFEHFIFMKLKAYESYSKSHPRLYYWRSTNHHEVDFLVGDHIAIEVKATRKTSDQDTKNLKALREENIHKVFVVVSMDPLDRKKDGILYLHWSEFLKRLWASKNHPVPWYGTSVKNGRNNCACLRER